MKQRPRGLPMFDASAPIMRAAGAWLARRDRGFTAAEAMEFAAWRGAKPSHAAALAQLVRAMTTFDALQEFAPDVSSEPDPDAFAPPRAVRRRWIFPALAAAGLAATVTLAFLRWSPSGSPATWHYATAAARYERATLADGSVIELNGDTVVDVNYTAAQRTVRLTRGEAHFQVAKNPARPFVVLANGVAFRAVGTAFQVRLSPSQVEMLVTEGKVQVEPPVAPTSAAATAAIPPLTAGHRIVVPSATATPPAIAPVSAAEMQQALAWQPQVAEFEQTPLSEVVAAFNRRNRVQITLADPALRTLRIGGNFRVDQPDAFVRLLETSFGVTAERADDGFTLRQTP